MRITINKLLPLLRNTIFYTIKPLMPRRFQIFLRRKIALTKYKKFSHIWPIEPNSGSPPKGWNGWPEGKKFALILTHDVDTQKGHDNCLKVAEIEEELGFRSSFNFVPERYTVSEELRNELKNRGFEVGVHGLNHDGKLYSSQETFKKRASRINEYLKDWKAVGFRSPAMHHNLHWIHDLNIKYDASTFDTDPFEPQSDGEGTIFPFRVTNENRHHGYVELPYTMVQDFTLFVLLRERSIDIWKRKLDWIVGKGGMALMNSHPDYMNFANTKRHFDEYPMAHYEEYLQYVASNFHGKYWNALPKDVASFWRKNMF